MTDTKKRGAAKTAPAGKEDHAWIRRLIAYLTSQTITLFGSMLVQYAIVWHITLTTKSGLMLTLSTVLGFLPQMLISLPAGVWADRYSRKLLIMTSDGIIALSTLALAVLWLSGYGSVWLLLVVVVIRSLGQGVQQPSVNAMIPQLVPQDKLMKSNGINGSIQSVTMLLAPVLAGVLLTFLSIEYIFFIDVATAFIGISMLSAIRIPLHAKAQEKNDTPHLEDMKTGIRYIMKHAFLKELIIYYFVFLFLIVPAALLTPLLVTRIYGDEVWRLTAMEVTFSVGAALGGILISAWGGFKNRVRTAMLSGVLFSVLSFVLGFTDQFWQFCAIMVFMGVSMPLFNTPVTVMLQETVEPDMLGRVFSLVQIGGGSAFPIGMMFFGPLADRFSISAMLIVCGVLCLLVTLAIRLNRALWCAEGSCEVRPAAGSSGAGREDA